MGLVHSNPEAHDYLDHFKQLSLDELYSPASVRERIDALYPKCEELHRLAAMRELNEESPLCSTPEFGILHKAYQRLYTLEEEVEQGIRYPNGDLTNPMC